jgi:hypothetical protein
VLLLVSVLGLTYVASAGLDSAAGMTDFAVGEDHITITLHAGAYRVSAGEDGQRIEMDGFGQLMVPGRPVLPMRRFLVALPPGAKARSIEVLDAGTERLPGVYSLEPASVMFTLTDPRRQAEALGCMQDEWQVNYEAAYRSDEPCPDRIAWLAGSGTLRKYSYAAVAFCPFTFHPLSGRLDYHDRVDVAIFFTMPASGSPDAELTVRLTQDEVADQKASALFSNYKDIADLYRPVRTGPAPISQAYDYVIVTTSDHTGAIASSGFPAWKASLGHSLRTVLVTDTEITSQPGIDLAEQIRNFLRTYYAAWGIEYVLMVGDYATVPMRICYPNPDYHVYNPGDPGLVAPGTPNDYYYADLSYTDAASWDSDGDGYHGEYGDDDPDFLAEVSVGRIPVNDTTRITYALDKLVAFEQDTGAWKSNALFAGAILFFENQDHGGYPFIDGATFLDSMEIGLFGAWTTSHYSEQTGVVTSPFPWPALTEASFTGAWRTGQFAIVNWSGHGWSDGVYRTIWGWDDGDGVPESGIGELYSSQFAHIATSNLDDDYPSIVFAVSCNVGYPDPNPYGNCGVDLLTLPGWGASAGIVSASRPASISGDWKNYPGLTESISYEFNRYMVSLGEKVGDALYDGKFYATTNYGRDHYYEYMNLYNFNLYGDPALRVDRATAGIATGGADQPDAGLRLLPGRPNPFSSTTTFRFALPASGPVRIAVHDVRGREVAVLAEGAYDAGEFIVTWDGTGPSGRRVGPGLYFVAIEAAGRSATSKVVLLK